MTTNVNDTCEYQDLHEPDACEYTERCDCGMMCCRFFTPVCSIRWCQAPFTECRKCLKEWGPWGVRLCKKCTVTHAKNYEKIVHHSEQ